MQIRRPPPRRRREAASERFSILKSSMQAFPSIGVVGAFALTKNLLVIAIGLGIGAMYVRSLTIMLVDRQTLSQFRFLEHGAFYAILVLAVIMFTQTLVDIPEALTGLVGAALIGLSIWSSIRWRKTIDSNI